ncbi:hypothetical protein RJ640_024054, partial [Escallonia rubra]
FDLGLLRIMLQHEINGAEDESEFDYDDGGPKGPSRWGELKEEWSACKTGEMQSPIDVSSRTVDVIPNSAGLTRNYKPSNATIVNRGHDISLKWVGDAGSVRINGTDYDLQQCHWHSPSEHTVYGRRKKNSSLSKCFQLIFVLVVCGTVVLDT